MIVFEQGALNTLYAAKRALERAIANYELCRNHPALTLDDGPLFATLDNITTVMSEIDDFCEIMESDHG